MGHCHFCDDAYKAKRETNFLFLCVCTLLNDRKERSVDLLQIWTESNGANLTILQASIAEPYHVSHSRKIRQERKVARIARTEN